MPQQAAIPLPVPESRARQNALQPLLHQRRFQPLGQSAARPRRLLSRGRPRLPGPGCRHSLGSLNNPPPGAGLTIAPHVCSSWGAGRIQEAPAWRRRNGRTLLPVRFDPSASVFVLFRRSAASADPVVSFSGPPSGLRLRICLDLGKVANLARVRLNRHDLGVIWKAPFVVEIGGAAVAGDNRMELEIANTWVNRLLGDSKKPESERTTDVAPARFSRGPQFTQPLPAGLLGPVRIFAEKRVDPQNAKA